MDFKFKVVHGPFKGATIYDTLIAPENASTVDAQRKLVQRAALYITRLGLATKEQLAGKAVQIDWSRAVGREVVIEAYKDTWKDKESGADKTKVKISFGGLFSLDSDQLSAADRQSCGLPPAPPKATAPNGAGGASGAAAPPPPAQTQQRGRYDNL